MDAARPEAKKLDSYSRFRHRQVSRRLETRAAVSLPGLTPCMAKRGVALTSWRSDDRPSIFQLFQRSEPEMLRLRIKKPQPQQVFTACSYKMQHAKVWHAEQLRLLVWVKLHDFLTEHAGACSLRLAVWGYTAKMNVCFQIRHDLGVRSNSGCFTTTTAAKHRNRPEFLCRSVMRSRSRRCIPVLSIYIRSSALQQICLTLRRPKPIHRNL